MSTQEGLVKLSLAGSGSRTEPMWLSDSIIRSLFRLTNGSEGENWEVFLSVQVNDQIQTCNVKPAMRALINDLIELVMQVPGVETSYQRTDYYRHWWLISALHRSLMQGLYSHKKYVQAASSHPEPVKDKRPNMGDYLLGRGLLHIELHEELLSLLVSAPYTRGSLGAVNCMLSYWAYGYDRRSSQGDLLPNHLKKKSDSFMIPYSSADYPIVEHLLRAESIYGGMRLAYFCLLFAERVYGLLPKGHDEALQDLALREAQGYMTWVRQMWPSVSSKVELTSAHLPSVPQIVKDLVDASILARLKG